ncbi:MAG: DNA repair exonuclease [Burkholderiales bacterium]
MSFRFLHAADLHIDSPLRGLARYEGAPVDAARGATRSAFTNLVDTAIREEVDLVVLAGDLFDGDWQDYNTGLFFATELAKLGESGIDVVVKRGNHDAASKVTRGLRLPSHVRILSEREPETVPIERLGAMVHGQSFPNGAVTDDLAARYPAPVPGAFNLGLLHTSLTGREGHDPYAPTSFDVLRAKGYDYWALGHVHAAEEVSQSPWIVFPGNTQGRRIRETGPKGCSLVTVQDGVVKPAFVPLDVLRWNRLALDITGLADLDALLDLASCQVREKLAAADGRAVALRVDIVGRGVLYGRLLSRPEQAEAELRNAALDASGGLAWLEKIQLRSGPAIDLDAIARQDDPLGALVRETRQLATSDDALRALAAEALGDLDAKLTGDLVDLRLSMQPGLLRELLCEIEGDLLERLREPGDTA